MTQESRDYKGFKLHASTMQGEQGFVPGLVIARHHGDHINEMKLTPPCPEEQFPTEATALAAAFTYGMAVIDGLVPGQSVEGM